MNLTLMNNQWRLLHYEHEAARIVGKVGGGIEKRCGFWLIGGN